MGAQSSVACAVPCLALALAAWKGSAQEVADDPWRELHAVLALRTDGAGLERLPRGPDLPLWHDSTYLLEPARRARLMAALAAVSAVNAPADAMRAVYLQQALWAAHDWAVDPRRSLPDEELARALARALEATAPSTDALTRLPDLLAVAEASGDLPQEPEASDPHRPFLPPGLSRSEGGWVRLAAEDNPGAPLAAAHALAFGGRSDFEVHLRLPGGREATRTWLEELRSRELTSKCRGSVCAQPEEPGTEHEHLARDLPALPPGSAVALVRRALVVDCDGILRVSPLVLSVQLRAFLLQPEDTWSHAESAQPPAGWPWQALCELELDLESASLRPVLTSDPLRFDPLGSHGDPSRYPRFPRGPQAGTCVGCHGMQGLASVITFTGFSTGPGTQFDLALRAPPRRLTAADAGTLRQAALDDKRAQEDWRLLQARRAGR